MIRAASIALAILAGAAQAQTVSDKVEDVASVLASLRDAIANKGPAKACEIKGQRIVCDLVNGGKGFTWIIDADKKEIAGEDCRQMAIGIGTGSLTLGNFANTNAVASAVCIVTPPASAQAPQAPKPAPPAPSCTEAGRASFCFEQKGVGLNIERVSTLIVSPAGALRVLEQSGIADRTVLFACRITGNNKAAQTDPLFAKISPAALSAIHDVRLTEWENLPDGRIKCVFTGNTLVGFAAPYEAQGPASKELAPCFDKLLSRVNAEGYRVIRQTKSTFFLANEEPEFTAKCDLSAQGEVSASIVGASVCKTSDFSAPFDLVGVPAEKRKQLSAAIITARRKAMRKADETQEFKKAGFIINVIKTQADACLVSVWVDKAE